jgi:hypothetical protein
MMLQQPPPQQRGGVVSTNMVLLTHVPAPLHHRQRLRHWLVACGNARNVQFVPAAPFDDGGVDNDTTDENEPQKQQQPLVCALLTMSHADVAVKLVTAFRHFKMMMQQRQPEQPHWFDLFDAHLVPTHPDIPLPPAFMDQATVQILGDKLVAAFPRTDNGNNSAAEATAHAATVIHPTTTTASTSTATTTRRPGSDSDDDEDDGNEEGDPLEAPAVVQAVREFRRALARQQGTKAVRRRELVKAKIRQVKPMVRERMLMQQQQQQQQPSSLLLSSSYEQQPPTTTMPPLPPMGGLLPPPPPPMTTIVPAVLLPPGSHVAPRSVSNLPAWMTLQSPKPPAAIQKDDDSESDPTGCRFLAQPPPPSSSSSSRTLEDCWNTPLLHAGALPPPHLEAFVTARVVHYVGEAERTLIDFVCRSVVESNTTSTTWQSLRPELEIVLEEDAVPFLQQLWAFLQEHENKE